MNLTILDLLTEMLATLLLIWSYGSNYIMILILLIVLTEREALYRQGLAPPY